MRTLLVAVGIAYFAVFFGMVAWSILTPITSPLAQFQDKAITLWAEAGLCSCAVGVIIAVSR